MSYRDNRFDPEPNPWSDPKSYVPDPADPAPNWWERNRLRVVVFAIIALIMLFAFVVPDMNRPSQQQIDIEGPEQ